MSRVNTKHGRSKSYLYVLWQQMKDRCYNEARRAYKHYGGRGIKVADRWLENFENFAADVAMLGERPYKAKFDRIDNNGHYEPGNVRWADDFLSAKNRRMTLWYEWKGNALTLIEIAVLENVDYNCFRNKIRIIGMTVGEAVRDCQARGLRYKERAKGKRPPIEITTTVIA
jgi:hypothetical protein